MRCLHVDRDCTSSSDAVVVSEQLLSPSFCNGGSSPQDLIDCTSWCPASPNLFCCKSSTVRHLHVDRDLASSSDAVAESEQLLSPSFCNGGWSPQDLIDCASWCHVSPNLFSPKSNTVRCLHVDRDCTSSRVALAVSEQFCRSSFCNGGWSPQDLIDCASWCPASPNSFCPKSNAMRCLHVDRDCTS